MVLNHNIYKDIPERSIIDWWSKTFGPQNKSLVFIYASLGLVIIKSSDVKDKPQHHNKHSQIVHFTDLLSCRPPAHTVVQQGFVEIASASAETRYIRQMTDCVKTFTTVVNCERFWISV